MCKFRYLNVLWLILMSLGNDWADADGIRSPASEFSRHNVVRPIVPHAKTKREITSTRHTEGIHHPEVTMTVNIDGLDHVLDLQLNEDLITQDHVIVYQKNGETVLHKPTLDELDICQYSGKVRGKKDSWVAVSTCDGVRGIIHDGKQMRYIQPAESNEIDSKHFIYEHSDLKTNFHCGYNDSVPSNITSNPELLKHLHNTRIENSRIARYKRETQDNTELRGPFNINKQSRFVEFVLVVDNGVFRANGESLATVHRQMKDLVNIVNSLYSPLNIYIALVGVVVWNERDEIRLEEDGDKTLTNFLRYRKQLMKTLPNDNAQLLTNQRLKDAVTGKAVKGPICTYEFSGAVTTNHSEVIGLVATTIAHELGHNFGMEHDVVGDCECPDEKCIMTASYSSVPLTKWSSCSIKSLAEAFERGMDYCLRNKPKRLFESSTCGNGFVEPGEQCDCGLAGDASCSACCHPRACVLRSNATCAAGECCDTATCRPKAAGSPCRAADKECDLPEYCSGHSEYCPRDVHKMDATPCAGGQAYCAGGSCRTHTDQCRLLWGLSGENSDAQCYLNSNTKGDKKGNCGYRREDPTVYYKCSKEDALCGLLQCRHLNERLEFGMESVSTLSAVFINNNGTIIPCRTAMVDLGTSDPDPGFVPDGAKCGHDKLCVGHRCVSAAARRLELTARDPDACRQGCSGHGVCNSEGHCHCDAGFAPPLCALPGPGGSVDSGPASDASVQRNFMVAMYVIFLGILPSVLLILFLLYYSRHNVLGWWKKPKKTYVSNMFKGPDFKQITLSSCSIVRLLNFKKTKKNKLCKKCNEDQIYSNICEHNDENNENNKYNFDIRYKIRNFVNRDTNIDNIKKFSRKINKDDIKVADNVDLANVTNKLESKVDQKNNKTNIVIINTGLASTTNENIKAEINITKANATKLNKNKASVDTNVNNYDPIYENAVSNFKDIHKNNDASVKVFKLPRNKKIELTSMNKNINKINSKTSESKVSKTNVKDLTKQFESQTKLGFQLPPNIN